MKYLIYISSAVKPMTDADLTAILKTSQANNLRDNITGMLVYSHGTFMQTLEGPKKEVDVLFDKLCIDTRHRHVMKLTEGGLNERNFPEWSMAFATFTTQAFNDLKGFVDPSSRNFMKGNNIHEAFSMLKTFAEHHQLIKK